MQDLKPGIETVSYFNSYGLGFRERFSTFFCFGFDFKKPFSNVLVLRAVFENFGFIFLYLMTVDPIFIVY